MERSRPIPILTLLGGAVILEGGTPVTGPATQRHRVALLALLALHERPMSRDKLIAYLWPERDTAGARNLLKSAVHEIRKAFGEEALPSIGDQLTLDRTRLGCDVHAFERAIAAGDHQAARALYAGPFLDGFFLKESVEFEEWAAAERTRLESRYRELASVEAVPAVPVRPATPVGPTAEVAPSPARRWLALTGIAVVGLFLLLGYTRRRAMAQPEAPKYAAVNLPDDSAGSALQFSDTTSNASTPLGAPITTQVDNIRVDMLLRSDPGPSNGQEVVYYNGNSALDGWGILVVGASEGQPEGTIALLAGGISITATPLTLTDGKWQHLTVERRNGQVTVTLDDRSFTLAAFPVNPLGGTHADEERTSIGGTGHPGSRANGFRGAIDRVRVRDLAGAYWIERWNFDEGAGPVAVSAKGTPLAVGDARWIPGTLLPPRDAFWRRLETLCGRAFAGKVTSGMVGDPLPREVPLVLHLFDCAPNELHAAIHVGTDRSRTWIIGRSGGQLLLREEFHRENGTVDLRAGIGGMTLDSGTATTQEFSDGAHHWELRVTPDQTVTYTLSQVRRAGALTMAFDLHRQLILPPLPWGFRAPDPALHR